MLKATVVFLAIVLCIVSGQRVRYDNYHVFNVKAPSLESLEILKNIQGANNTIRFLNGIHFLNQDDFVLVAPEHVAEFENKLKRHGVIFKLVETNAQKELEEDENDIILKPRSKQSSEHDWKDYYDVDENYDWMKSLAKKYPNIIEVIIGGKSYEGRPILGVKLSHKKGNKGIFIEGGMHAREWIGPATATYILNKLLTSQEPDIRELAENYDWYIFPHANPDGYAFTRAANGDRLWRMTRSKQDDGCWGVDPNRNWDFHWAEVGVSYEPCVETYAGKSAFSEIETKSLSEYILSLKGKIQLYLALHSYSQLILYPYGHTPELPINNKDYQQIFNATKKAFAARYGTEFTGGNIHDAIYPASGASCDWAYGLEIVKLAFTFELRPAASKFWIGFKLPKKDIIPASEETCDAVVALVNEAKKLRYFD